MRNRSLLVRSIWLALGRDKRAAFEWPPLGSVCDAIKELGATPFSTQSTKASKRAFGNGAVSGEPPLQVWPIPGSKHNRHGEEHGVSPACRMRSRICAFNLHARLLAWDQSVLTAIQVDRIKG